MNRRNAFAFFPFVWVSCETGQQEDHLSALYSFTGTDVGEWVSSDTVDMEPSQGNFRALAVLTNKAMTSLSWFRAMKL